MRLRVGIVSFAHVHAPGHVELLKGRGDVELIGAFDNNRDRGLYYANRYGLELLPSIDLLIRRRPDFVVIDSETVMHLEYVKMFAENSINVFCEKPIGSNIQMAREIKNIVEKHGILFTTGFNSRFNQDVVKLKEILAEGGIGDLYMVRVRIAHSAAIDRWFKEWTLWFGVRELAGGGGLLDLGIHAADLLRYILNDEATEVSGVVTNLTKTYEVDDFGVGIVSFSKGTLSILESGWVQVAENPSLSPLEVYGSSGTILRTPIGIVYYSRDRKAWIKPSPTQVTIRNALEDMMDSIKMGRKPTITVDDAVKAQEIIEAVYLSSKEKRAVKLPLQ
ncbi:MAG: Gfo/Idh/MocA family oxidoreductase [Ignisphaera sp.]|nr:Gfo/Idh/MocA family oxidoreductase [Ignisphaera sp.]MCX8167558.1 Gfo/Idh/MocA family oxidoreductase [Ignisphaera sp.]MDW8086025.1 Gfo/Idh/MocA family oxidoreductase [Ignisphaera sp.]